MVVVSYMLCYGNAHICVFQLSLFLCCFLSGSNLLLFKFNKIFFFMQKKKKTPRFLPMHILCFIDQLIKIYNIILYIFIPFIYPLPSKLHALKVSMRHWFCEDAKRTFDYFSHHFNRALSTDPCQLPARKFTSA